MKIVKKFDRFHAGPAIQYERSANGYRREMYLRSDGLWTYDHDTGIPLVTRRKTGGWRIDNADFREIVFPCRMAAVAAWLVAGRLD